MTQAFDAIVIGAGAAGLMCALTAGARGKRVLVLDHAERVGKKILMSGGGRCNFTNTGTSPGNFLSANPHFCKSALARYTPEDFIALVDRHGIGWHEKEFGQLFCDDSASHIVRMLLGECEQAQARVLTHCAVTAVTRSEGDGTFAVASSRGQFFAENLVVATGGLSIPRIGATGFGYALARQFGHSVLPTRAGLVPLTLGGPHAQALTELSGVALPVCVETQGVAFRNRMLLTHRGVSGPAILQISSYWQPPAPLRVDLLPEQDAETALREAQRDRPATELRTLLSEWWPKRFAQVFCAHWLPDIDPTRALRSLAPRDVLTIAQALSHWSLPANGDEGYRTAEVTLGGVDTRELSSASMQSQRVRGLYFIGEVVDVTGWLGGYNFQWAWASGHAAGLAL